MNADQQVRFDNPNIGFVELPQSTDVGDEIELDYEFYIGKTSIRVRGPVLVHSLIGEQGDSRRFMLVSELGCTLWGYTK